MVRKALGLTFVGETREEDVIVVGDIHITGLDNKVDALLYSLALHELTSGMSL